MEIIEFSLTLKKRASTAYVILIQRFNQQCC